MKEELQLKIIERFPQFYKPNLYGCNQKRFYFECMDGFFDLIWKTSEDIENALKKYPVIYLESFSIVQVKTKFRELRVYWGFDKETAGVLDTNTSSLIYSNLVEITNRAGTLSRSLCEVCGRNIPAEHIDMTNNWILKCPDCAKKEQDEKQSSEI